MGVMCSVENVTLSSGDHLHRSTSSLTQCRTRAPDYGSEQRIRSVMRGQNEGRKFCRSVSIMNGLRASLAKGRIPISCNVALGEPNYFSPNPDSPVVDAIGPPASAIASQDIPNSATPFRTIMFSPSGRGEPFRMIR